MSFVEYSPAGKARASLVAADVASQKERELDLENDLEISTPLRNLFLTVGIVCSALSLLYRAEGTMSGTAVAVGAATVMFLAAWCMHRGKTVVALSVALWGLVAVISVFVLNAELGVHDLAMNCFPAILVVAAVVLAPRHYLVFSGAVLLIIGSIGVLDMVQVIVHSRIASGGSTVITIFTINAMTALTAGVVANRLRAAVKRSRGRAEELAAKNSFIEQQRETLVAQKHEIESLLSRAEEASRLKGEFLANMSHEIRTPMNAILGMSQLSLTTKDTARQREYAQNMHDAATALLSVINDVLDLSAVEAGKLALDSRPFPVRECVQGVEKLLRWRADEKGLRFDCQVDAAVPAWVEGDAGRIRQILLNLAGNAIKFTERGYVRIRVVPLLEKDAPELAFQVEDSGIGIPADQLERIFQPFTQVDGSMRRAQGGTGLGLTISARLAERMGGVIEVASEAGRGSRFTFRVALRPASPPVNIPVPAPAVARPLRILLAEDNRINQRIATRMLEELGHHVECVSNGQQAVSHAKAFSYDLIFMDIQMPEMDGYAATQAIRALPPPLAETPIIALTAHAMTGDRENCLAAGMDDYVSKPVSLDSLREALRRALPERSSAA